MASKNLAILIGGCTRDPEVRMTPSGQKVATLSLATSEKYTDKNTGQKTDKVEYHNLVFWRKTAEIVERYVKKGTQLYIEGKLTTRSWDDQQSGQKRSKTEIVVSQMQMLGGRSDGMNQDRPTDYRQDGASYEYDQTPVDDSDIPF